MTWNRGLFYGMEKVSRNLIALHRCASCTYGTRLSFNWGWYVSLIDYRPTSEIWRQRSLFLHVHRRKTVWKWTNTDSAISILYLFGFGIKINTLDNVVEYIYGANTGTDIHRNMKITVTELLSSFFSEEMYLTIFSKAINYHFHFFIN